MSFSTFEVFEQLEIRVGTVIHVEHHTKAVKPAYLIKLDFGPYGIKQSSAQLTALYTPADLIGKQLIAILNFPPKQVANHCSECLILGAMNDTDVIVIQTERPVQNGLRIG